MPLKLNKEQQAAAEFLNGIALISPPPIPIEPYHSSHIDAILKVLEFDWKHAKTQRQRMLAARNKAIFILFLESGLRLEELAKLGIGDINLDKQTLIVRFGKMGKSRLSGFGPHSKKALWKYLSLRSQLTDIDGLWITEEGSQLSVSGVQIIIRRLKKEAGLEHIKGSVHIFHLSFFQQNWEPVRRSSWSSLLPICFRPTYARRGPGLSTWQLANPGQYPEFANLRGA